ncbi:peptidoglycan DD-metalloendopeptidase family protein [Streptomyces sp. NPDC012888]|uniref:peptidoglycan DD-metalloendopeptidase family protein n=1 Tax=Streptomyces sp. NPDC012888 TaxID=3364855 RepID=UPI0036AD7CFE
MNDRPLSGQYPVSGYDGLSTSSFTGDLGYGSYETQAQGFDYTAGFDAYGNGYATPDASGVYDTTAWSAAIPAQAAPEDTTGQWYAAGYQPAAFGYDASQEQTGHWAVPGYAATAGTETGAYDATAWNTVAQEELPQQYSYGYDQPQDTAVFEPVAPGVQGPAADGFAFQETAFSQTPFAEAQFTDAPFAGAPFSESPFSEPSFPEAPYGDAPYDDEAPYADELPEPGALHAAETQTMPQQPAADTAPGPRAARRAAAKNTKVSKTSGAGKTGAGKGGAGKAGAANSRRRTPAKRSALLTVAVPSVCVMGVAGVAAASVGGLTDAQKPVEETKTLAAADPASIKPVAANNKLDTQLTALSADAGDFADRASRTQERIDLRVAQEEARKKAAEEAARKEALRPKFALPVKQHGLSASFGQSGGMWMSVHTGIDFPVGYGTPVMAATDGVVRTQYNSAYGNMAIVTSPDGTETWYCHLSSTKIRSGKVKAGDVIAYSGNSGNSTGPHLHFEVRPGGGSPVDPTSWFRSHGLNPN